MSPDVVVAVADVVSAGLFNEKVAPEGAGTARNKTVKTQKIIIILMTLK